jgi:hypothetical protein
VPFSKKHGRRLAKQDLPNRLEMRATRLDLLGQGVDVAEAALVGAARENCIDAGRSIAEVGDIDGGVYGSG